MKNRARNATLAAALAVLFWPAVRANAACSTNLADSTNLDCVYARGCQKAILKRANGYMTAVQTQMQLMINKSILGVNLVPQSVYKCQGCAPLGPSLCVPLTCKGNNGGCITGKIGAPCNDNADCGPGHCSHLPGQGCNSTLIDSITGTLDQFECQPSQTSGPFSAGIVAAQNNLVRRINAACNNPLALIVVNPADLGLDRIPGCLVGQCAGGTKAGDPCNTANPGGQCPGSSCDVSDYDKVYLAIAQCIERSADGDLSGGKVVDMILRPLGKVTGTGKLPAQHGPISVSGDLLARSILQMAGSNTLQIGSGIPGNIGNSPSAGGGVTQMTLAHCTGGNMKVACLNNADCGVGGSCDRNMICNGGTQDGKLCNGTSPSTSCCTSTALCLAGVGACAVGGSGRNVFTATQPVHKCCDSASGASTGNSCLTSATCGAGTCSVNTACLGNILTVTETKSNGLTTCLVTHTKNSGNGTAAAGTINLTTGDYGTHAPIATDVYLHTCARCSKNLNCNPAGTRCCDDGVNLGGACLGTEGSTDQACLGSTPILATVPNPFDLTTGTASLNGTVVRAGTCGFCETTGSPANGACDTPPCDSCGTFTAAVCAVGKSCDTGGATVPHNAICGHCDTAAPGDNGLCDHGGANDPVCSIGCSDPGDVNGECTTKTGSAVTGHCDFGTTGGITGGSAPGFHGDCSVKSIVSKGEVHQYAPISVGAFCTGQTGVLGPPNIDTTAGLPGPVRIVQPYVWAYVLGK